MTVLGGNEMLNWRCPVCGAFVGVDADSVNFREFRACKQCHASKRTADIARVLLRWIRSEVSYLSGARDELESFAIYLLESSGPLYEMLKRSPKFICSEYIDDVKPGTISGGVRVEDVQSLTFSDDLFDFVISQDVLEHVPDYKKAFREIFRVLKPGGAHIFTVPFRKSLEKSFVRAVVEDGVLRHIAEPDYHHDKLRPEGILVFTDFGRDMFRELRDMGYRVASLEESYFDFAKGGYNVVFVAQKPTGR